MHNEYEGWELDDFDSAKNFRSYQFDLISNYIRGKVAEVGPGTGNNIQHYLSKTDTLSLYEPTNKLFNKLKLKYKENTNINIYNETFLNQKAKFDTIIYLDVLEHIKDDKKEFLNAFERLNVNGSLIINVPAFNFLYSQFDKDVNHNKRYNKEDFNSFLELTKHFGLNEFSKENCIPTLEEYINDFNVQRSRELSIGSLSLSSNKSDRH